MSIGRCTEDVLEDQDEVACSERLEMRQGGGYSA